MTQLKTISLSNGPLQFSAIEQGSGPLVLFLHGFPDNKYTFSAQLPALAKAGYRAVSVSLRGYEPSSQPQDNDYSAEALAGDVIACLDDLGEQTAHLIGHDWGAAIGYTVCAAAPERFRSFAAIALPHNGRFLNEIIKHPKQLRNSWYMLFFQLGSFATRRVRHNRYQFIRNLWRVWSADNAVPKAHLEQVIESLDQPGVLDAALQYYRTALSIKALSQSARKANQFNVHVPTLALSGAKDGCINTDAFEKMMREEDFPNGLQFERIGSAGHFLHIDQPELVNERLITWLNKWEAEPWG